MTNETIVEKIVNLMKRAEGHDDAESQSSIALAQRLMLKHNISIEEVKQQSERSEIRQSHLLMRRVLWWQKMLAANVADHFRCKVMLGHDGLYFVGMNDDADICRAVYEGAVSHIKYRRSQMKDATKKEKRSFILGFMVGLDEKLEEQKKYQVTEEMSLMLLVPREVTDYVSQNSSRTHSVKVKDSIDFVAYSDGVVEGKEAEILKERIID